jgi:Highly conserved protein containing a thioredoxin domain
MLYDNALLIRFGVNLWQATKDDEARIATARAVDWVKREMTSPEGGFYSSLDADSEGHEGLFYVWSEEELDSLLGEDAALAKSYYGVSAEGNFEGKNILFVGDAPAVTASRAGLTLKEMGSRLERIQKVLYDARSRRVRPGLDDKILAGWNGLMLRAVALAARAFDRPDWRDLAIANAQFLRGRMTKGGRVMRSTRTAARASPVFSRITPRSRSDSSPCTS